MGCERTDAMKNHTSNLADIAIKYCLVKNDIAYMPPAFRAQPPHYKKPSYINWRWFSLAP